MEDDLLKLESDNGVVKEYRILLVFKWYKNDKFYMVYTDRDADLNDEYNVYAKIFDPNDLNVLEDIKTDEEWNMIDSKLKEITTNND